MDTGWEPETPNRSWLWSKHTVVSLISFAAPCRWSGWMNNEKFVSVHFPPLALFAGSKCAELQNFVSRYVESLLVSEPEMESSGGSCFDYAWEMLVDFAWQFSVWLAHFGMYVFPEKCCRVFANGLSRHLDKTSKAGSFQATDDATTNASLCHQGLHCDIHCLPAWEIHTVGWIKYLCISSS